MNTFIKVVVCVSLTVIFQGCVKIQIKPQDIVSDTVAASKDLYETIARKRDGKEERLYTHTVDIASAGSQDAASEQCSAFLKKAAAASSEKPISILEESTEILETENASKLKCSLRAIVE